MISLPSQLANVSVLHDPFVLGLYKGTSSTENLHLNTQGIIYNHEKNEYEDTAVVFYDKILTPLFQKIHAVFASFYQKKSPSLDNYSNLIVEKSNSAIHSIPKTTFSSNIDNPPLRFIVNLKNQNFFMTSLADIHRGVGIFHEISLFFGDTLLYKGFEIDLQPLKKELKVIDSLELLLKFKNKEIDILKKIPKTAQKAILSVLVNGRPYKDYDCADFISSYMIDTYQIIGYHEISSFDIENELKTGDVIWMGIAQQNKEYIQPLHAALYLDSGVFLSVGGKGKGLIVTPLKTLIQIYNCDLIIKMNLHNLNSD